ncbi:MAG TPA: hypothetical protein VFI12_08725, partial [Thermomicrobiales bacterium]|nr:hypothetical protein [Thermomicrobiales bacterium]
EVQSQVASMMTDRAEPNASAAIMGGWRSFVFVGLTAAGFWAYGNARLELKAAGFALIALVAADLWSIEREYWMYMPPASVTFATDDAIEAIKKDIASTGEPGRTILLFAGQGLSPNDAYFRKNALMNQLLRTVEGEQGNELDIYRRMVQLDSGNVVLNPTFWRHENVRYLYTGADEATLAGAAQQLHVPPFVRLAGPVKNANGSTVYSYRVGPADPFAWVASGAVRAQPEQVLPTVLDPRYNPAIAAIVDTGSTLPVKDASQLVPSTVTVKTTSYSPGKIAVELSAPATDGSILVLSENWYPGWSARGGSASLPTARANYNLIGVSLPAGAKSIELAFADASYARGKVVTFVALFVAGVLLIAGVVIDRRRRVAEPAAA